MDPEGDNYTATLAFIPVGLYFWAVSRMRRSMLWLCSCCVDRRYLSFIKASQDNSSSSSFSGSSFSEIQWHMFSHLQARLSRRWCSSWSCDLGMEFWSCDDRRFYNRGMTVTQFKKNRKKALKWTNARADLGKWHFFFRDLTIMTIIWLIIILHITMKSASLIQYLLNSVYTMGGLHSTMFLMKR